MFLPSNYWQIYDETEKKMQQSKKISVKFVFEEGQHTISFKYCIHAQLIACVLGDGILVIPYLMLMVELEFKILTKWVPHLGRITSVVSVADGGTVSEVMKSGDHCDLNGTYWRSRSEM